MLVLLGAGNGFGGYGNGGYQQGFDQAAVMGGINTVNSNVTNGFASAEVAACGRAMDSMQTAYNNQIASMNQSFANQQALNAQLVGMQSQQAECLNITVGTLAA